MTLYARSLSFRLALSFGLFVALGSMLLAIWLYAAEKTQSLEAFAQTARANAEFVRTARLPLSERTSGSLGQVLGFAVVFVENQSEAPPVRIDGDPIPADLLGLSRSRFASAVRSDGYEAILLPVSGDTSMWFVRRSASLWSAMGSPRTLLVLAAFWVLALALAVVLARGIVRPLRRLTDRLPQIGNDPEATLPGAERGDEIGALARAYLDTRAQLAEERARRESAERLALLGRMATGLAHEIHNPLSAIRMHAQLLESAPPAELAESARESLPSMLSETAKIESLVNQWMFLARPEPPKTSRVSLAAVVQQAARSHEPAARHSGVEIALEVPEAIEIDADSRRLSQAVSNVIVNAIQAMPEGGPLRIAAESGGRCVLLRFSDAGRGFSPEALQRGSELFYSEKEGGMGIGLSVTSEVLKAMGGALRVENGLAGGAIVTFELPNP